MKQAFPVLIILILLSSIGTSFGSEVRGIGRYPLPLVEAEILLTKWLQQEKYTVSSNELANSAIELHGAAPGKTIRILIRPRSPLATEVELLEPSRLDEGAAVRSSWELFLAHKTGKPGSVTVIPEQVRLLADAVVCINSPTAGDRKLNFTGFLADTSGTIITIAHDFDKLRDIKLTFPSGAVTEGIVLKRDTAKDLSLITSAHTGYSNFFSLKEGKSTLNFGEQVYMLCCDTTGKIQIQSGIVNKPKAMVNSQSLLQVTLENVFFGSSGSPVVDKNGLLVGVVKGRFRGAASRGFLIPLDTVRSFVGVGNQ